MIGWGVLFAYIAAWDIFSSRTLSSAARAHPWLYTVGVASLTLHLWGHRLKGGRRAEGR